MLTKLETPEFKSCLPQEPFIKFGTGTGTAIDLNLPQTNEFSAYGIIPIDTKGVRFKTQPPVSDPYFDELFVIKSDNDAAKVASAIEAKLRILFNQGQIKTVSNDIIEKVWVATSYTDSGQGYYENRTKTVNAEYLADTLLSQVILYIQSNDVKPIISSGLGGILKLSFQKPFDAKTAATPGLFIVEEYRMAAYLGKYGLGRVVRTFSLLPGEKTTITLKTYRDVTTTKSQSENVLDSYSTSSANEFQTNIENETTNTSDKMLSTDFHAGIKAVWTVVSAQTSIDVKSSSRRTSNVKDLTKALEKHVNNSNSNRQVQVNTTTTETVKEGEENSTVRQLENINRSRVLNFVFRQLHQQYTTVTYLADIKVGFSNGNPDDTRIVSLEELDGLLNNVIEYAYIPSGNMSSIDSVKNKILNNYCQVSDYKDVAVPFIEKVTTTAGTCFQSPSFNGIGANLLMQPETTTFWRVKKGIKSTISQADLGLPATPTDSSLPITIQGVILGVKESTLKTSSVLVESMLGQTDALDCFNLKIQDAESQRSYIENTERLTRLQIEELRLQKDLLKQQAEVEKVQVANELKRLQMKIITDITDPVQQAARYKDVFGTCCETAQTIIQN